MLTILYSSWITVDRKFVPQSITSVLSTTKWKTPSFNGRYAITTVLIVEVMKASSHAVSLSCDKIMYLLHVLVAVVREKCPNKEFSLVRIFRIQPEYGKIRTRKSSVLDTFHAVQEIAKQHLKQRSLCNFRSISQFRWTSLVISISF